MSNLKQEQETAQAEIDNPIPAEFQHYFDEKAELVEKLKKKNKKRNKRFEFIFSGIALSLFGLFAVPMLFVSVPVFLIGLFGWIKLNGEVKELSDQLEQLGIAYKEEYRRSRFTSTADSYVPGPNDPFYYQQDNVGRGDDTDKDDCPDCPDCDDFGDYGGWDSTDSGDTGGGGGSDGGWSSDSDGGWGGDSDGGGDGGGDGGD